MFHSGKPAEKLAVMLALNIDDTLIDFKTGAWIALESLLEGCRDLSQEAIKQNCRFVVAIISEKSQTDPYVEKVVDALKDFLWCHKKDQTETKIEPWITEGDCYYVGHSLRTVRCKKGEYSMLEPTDADTRTDLFSSVQLCQKQRWKEAGKIREMPT